MTELTKEGLLKLLEINAAMVWKASLNGSEAGMELFRVLKNVQVGDLVLEITTTHAKNREGTRLGRLLKIAAEPIEGSENWNVETDGPVPLERVYYLELANGTEFRWRNASFIKVLEEIYRG